MKAWGRYLAFLWVALIVGCAVPREFPPTALEPSAPLIDVDAALTRLGAEKSSEDGSPIQQVSSKSPHRTILVLSGGGMRGSFTAGLLRGWTESGNRPEFDVVTGISTGALIAVLAFLGPEYDGLMEKSYTSFHPGDVYRRKPLAVAVLSDSLADSGPLKKHIDAQVTRELLQKVAVEHAAGRRLYVGTTNLDNRRLVVWDMGAIACSDDPDRLDLFRNILLASCSVPGLLPPVPIAIEVNGRRYTEMHVDGGVAASVFLQPYMLYGPAADPVTEPCQPLPAETDIYIVIAGKLLPTPGSVSSSWLKVSAEALDGLLQARREGDLLRLFLMSWYTGAHFHLAAVPQDLPLNPNAMAFDTSEMKRLFEAGYRVGMAGQQGWLQKPPSIDMKKQNLPRAGTRFTMPVD